MWRLSALFFLVVLAPAAYADDLQDILDRDRLAVQRLVSEVNHALAQAKACERAEPARAKKILEAALGKITDARELPEGERAGLRRRVQARLTEIARQLRARELVEEEAARRAADKLKRDRDAGPDKSAAAQDLVKRYSAATRGQLAASEQLFNQKAKGQLGVFSALEASATPIDGVVEYPKYWAKLTESRKNFVGNKLTQKEVTLLKTLNSSLSVDFNGVPFRDVINYLSEKTGLAIIVDENSLKDAGGDYSDPVTLRVKKVTVRTILKKVLADHNLGYTIQEGTIQVMTAQRARETMVVRAYPVDDLVNFHSNFYGPWVNQAVKLANVQALIQNIERTIDPTLWNVNGGPGAITYSATTRSLVIRAPAELHYMFGGGGFFR